MTALQVIIKEAKAIRKKNPKMEWKKAVAQSSAIYASKHKGKSPVGKKKAAKKVVRKKAAKKRIGLVKKKVAKKIAKKRSVSKPKSLHKDTKSHNVNIRVMSGIGGHALDSIKQAMQTQSLYEFLYRKYMAMPLKERKMHSATIKKLKHLIKEHKTHITQLKKGI